MSRMGSLGTNMSGREHRQGDMSSTSCSNLERSEARWFRTRIQAGWGRDWGLAGDTFTWVGQGLRTEFRCSVQSHAACGCLRVCLLQSLSENFGEFPQEIQGKRFSQAVKIWWVDSLFENKTPAPGKGKLLGTRKPKTWAVTRVARTGRRKKLMCDVYLRRPRLPMET